MKLFFWKSFLSVNWPKSDYRWVGGYRRRRLCQVSNAEWVNLEQNDKPKMIHTLDFSLYKSQMPRHIIVIQNLIDPWRYPADHSGTSRIFIFYILYNFIAQLDTLSHVRRNSFDVIEFDELVLFLMGTWTYFWHPKFILSGVLKVILRFLMSYVK